MTLQFEDIKEPQPNELPEALNLRVWNKLHKEYFYVEYDKDYNQIILTNKAKTSFYPLTSLLFTSQWEKPERPTGLPDKNGKLIYDDDILKVIHKDKIFISKIFYSNKKGGFVIYYVGDYGMSHEVLIDGLDVEILGNIHTTPELLEVNDIELSERL